MILFLVIINCISGWVAIFTKGRVELNAALMATASAVSLTFIDGRGWLLASCIWFIGFVLCIKANKIRNP